MPVAVIRGDRGDMGRGLSNDLGERRARQAGVRTVKEAIGCLGEPAVRWRLASGRWRRVCRGVIVTQSGPLSEEQRLWVPLLAAGEGAVLAGLTAAKLAGLTGFDDQRIYLLIPSPRRARKARPGGAVHRSMVPRPAGCQRARLPPPPRP